ncbi:MAG: hypothetical protein HRU36_02555 [Rickettsiales bacterium]|nr:hypothetical protein [Rickettsiales bacterium]
MKKIVAKAPGKLILTGEYSVLYNMPAIVFTIDKATTTTAKLLEDKIVVIELKDFNLIESFSQYFLNRRYLFIRNKYNQFLSGVLSIDKVLEIPVDVCCFLIGYIFDRFKIKQGIELSIESTIPIGAGFGSSAAFVVSLLKSLDALFSLNLNQEEFFQIALKGEKLIHGSSSGVDVRASLIGGSNYLDGGISAIDIKDFEFFSIFTGKPEASTGESISKVKNILKTSDKLQMFKKVALKLKDAIENKNLLDVMSQIKTNHALLKELGVVPQKVQEFIKEIEANNCAAKISGSGAVAGENAGVVISMGNFTSISKIAKKFGYTVSKIKQSSKGAYAL